MSDFKNLIVNGNTYAVKDETARTNITSVVGDISDAYDSTSTYAVGDYCIYDNVLYVCNTAIETAEAFDSTKWTATTVTDIIDALPTAGSWSYDSDSETLTYA